MRNALAAALAALLLAACSAGTDTSPSPTASTIPSEAAPSVSSPEASPTTSTSIPDGWELVAIDDAGFTLALPEEWLTVSAADVAATGVFEQMAEDNPEAAAVMEQARQAIQSGQMSFMAFETGQRTVETGFAANMNVVRVVDDGSSTIDEIAAQMKLALPLQIPGLEVVDTDTTVLPGGEAAIVRSRWTVEGDQGQTALSLTQYAILTGGGEAHILSFTAPEEHAADYAETWAGIAESFTVD
jgi:hypothetical protein